MTRPYAEVIGDPIAQSKSPAIHTFWLGKRGIDAEYRACHVRAGDVGDYFARRRDDARWRGCNVTMPHKRRVMTQLDRIDPLAEAIGAVNTVLRDQDGSLTGYNTDVQGFLEPLGLVEGEIARFRRIEIIGTGGAARAIIAATALFANKGVEIVVAGRNRNKAQALLAERHDFRNARAAELSAFLAEKAQPSQDAPTRTLLVNASPLGMAGQDPLEIDLAHVSPETVIYDIVTHPLDTALLKAARARGLAAIDGLSMLIGQAAAAFVLFFNVPTPREHDDELRALLTA